MVQKKKEIICSDPSPVDFDLNVTDFDHILHFCSSCFQKTIFNE